MTTKDYGRGIQIVIHHCIFFLLQVCLRWVQRMLLFLFGPSFALMKQGIYLLCPKRLTYELFTVVESCKPGKASCQIQVLCDKKMERIRSTLTFYRERRP